MKRLQIFSAVVFLLLFSGCVTTGEYVALKNDVNRLKRNYYAQDRKVAVIEKDIDVIKGTSSRSVGKESFKAIRESQEQINSQLLSLTKDFQALQGRFDENKFFVEKYLKNSELELNALSSRIEKLEKESDDLKQMIVQLRVALTQKELEQPIKDTGKKSDRKGVSAEAEKMYKEAYGVFKKGDYKEARQKFTHFLKNYPKHDLSDNAQFWIGEGYYREKEYADAILAFENLIKGFPKSTKIPNALLKQAKSFEAMGDKKTSKVIYKVIIDKYPKSSEAKKASAALKTLSKKKKR